MSCGFSCSKNTLIAINVVYVMVAFLLIGVATYGKTSSIVVTIPLVGGIVACGVFLLFVAVLGLVATFKHHQVMLFFYMLLLFGIFIIQFSVSCACIGMKPEQEQKLAHDAWYGLEHQEGFPEWNLIKESQKLLGCCGYDDMDPILTNKTKEWTDRKKECPPACQQAANNQGTSTKSSDTSGRGTRATGELDDASCATCEAKLRDTIDSAFNASGGLGLFFSLTEFVTIVVTYRFRKQIQEQLGAIA